MYQYPHTTYSDLSQTLEHFPSSGRFGLCQSRGLGVKSYSLHQAFAGRVSQLENTIREDKHVSYRTASGPKVMNLKLGNFKFGSFWQVSMQFLSVSQICALAGHGWKEKPHVTTRNAFLVVWRKQAHVLHPSCWGRTMLHLGFTALPAMLQPYQGITKPGRSCIAIV